MMPIIVSLPVMSIKPFREYLSKRLLLRGKKPVAVVTEISLTRDKNSTGINYSRCAFKKVADLTPEEVEKAKATGDFVKSIAMNVSIEDAPIDSDFETVAPENAPAFEDLDKSF